MKNILFGAFFVLTVVLSSCSTSTTKVEEVKTTEDSTKVEHSTEAVSVTTPSVDTVKVEKKSGK
jgi:hypothetical protein